MNLTYSLKITIFDPHCTQAEISGKLSLIFVIFISPKKYDA